MTPRSHDQNDLLEPEILSVSQLNATVARYLADAFGSIWVKGEISNFTQAASGHWYFTLKDDGAATRAVMFRSRAQAVGFTPRAGDKVELRARVSLYEARGDYQLQVDAMRRSGVGDLYEAFLKLKQKLQDEGLFDPERKRRLTAIPRAIGVVTSRQAAALRDVLSALARRAPHIPVIIYPAPVQGPQAGAALVRAIEAANARDEVDVLLLVRGGGSIEDLWSFNEEILARAVAASRLPVISGVGHETDFTICDFVADLRAPTPTAAAELSCTPLFELQARVQQGHQAALRAHLRRLAQLAQKVDYVASRLISPAERLRQRGHLLAGLVRRLTLIGPARTAVATQRLATACSALTHVKPDVGTARKRVNDEARRLGQAARQRVGGAGQQLALLAARLAAQDPQHPLERGFALVTDETGEIVRSATQLHADQPLTVKFKQGTAGVKVTSSAPSTSSRS